MYDIQNVYEPNLIKIIVQIATSMFFLHNGTV